MKPVTISMLPTINTRSSRVPCQRVPAGIPVPGNAVIVAPPVPVKVKEVRTDDPCWKKASNWSSGAV